MSWPSGYKRPAMWPRCKPSRLQSFKDKLSKRKMTRQPAELLERTVLLQEETILVPIASWTPVYWDVLTILMVLLDRGEIGVLLFVPIRRPVSPDWNS